MSTRPFANDSLARAFQAYPPAARNALLALRELIFATAATAPGVGELEETLKWGEPAYLTSASKSGSTLRIGWNKATPAQYALYVNCKTDLIDTFRTLFADELKYAGKRAIVLDLAAPLPGDALAVCIAATLTYHRDRRERR